MKGFIFSLILLLINGLVIGQKFKNYFEEIHFDPYKRENTKKIALNFDHEPQLIALSLKWISKNNKSAPKFICRYSKDNKIWEEIVLLPENHLETDGTYGTCLPVYLPEDAKEISILPGELSDPVDAIVNIFTTYDDSKPIKSSENIQITNCFCDTLSYRSRSQWDCPNPPRTYSYTDVSHLIVHHAAGSNTSSNWAAVVLSIWNFHVNTNGWADIGYNWLIDPNGVLYEGRGGGNNVVGAHFCGKNSKTMGVCMLGNLNTAEPTELALATLRKLLFWKSCDSNVNPLTQSVHSGSLINHISGHRDGCATECPGNNMYPKLTELRSLVKASLESCATTSLNDFEDNDPLFFPNPAKNEIFFAEPPGWVKIFDYSGKLLLYTSYIENQNVNISHLQSGKYFIQILDTKKNITTQKLIIRR